MKKTCGIYLISYDGLLLVGHPTNAPANVWSIPKGLQEPGETDMETAIREFQEETAILVSTIYLEQLPLFPYPNGKKTLSPFIFKSYLPANEFNPKCESMVQAEVPFPEIDDFKWVTIDEALLMLHSVQIDCLVQIREKYGI